MCKESLHVRLLDTGIQIWQFVMHDLICNGGEIPLPVLQIQNTGIFIGNMFVLTGIEHATQINSNN